MIYSLHDQLEVHIPNNTQSNLISINMVFDCMLFCSQWVSSSRKLHPNSILGSWERLSFDTLEEDAVSDSSQLQQHCRQVKVCLAATVLSPPTHPTRIDQCQALAEDNTKKPTHLPSKTYKDTQDTLLDSTFLRSFLSLQLYPCFAAHMWITHTMVVRLGISEVAVCYL